MKDKKEKMTRTSRSTIVDNRSSLKSMRSEKRRQCLRFQTRTISDILLFWLFFSLCLLFASKTLEKEKIAPINYSDASNVTYKVYLNKNDIYHEDYLGMNRAYVANLINHLDVDFNYSFSIDKLTDMEFEYKIVANLIIENKNGTNYVDEDFVIKETTKNSKKACGDYTIDENVIIDYAYYNNLANKFRNQTGVDVNSYLNLYMLVNKKTVDNANYKIDDNSKLIMKIPLSERAIEITMDSSSQSLMKQIIPTASVVFNMKYLILEIIFFLLSCMVDVKIIKYIIQFMNEETAYDKYVKKLLKDYDRLIVEAKTKINFDNYRVVDVNSFTELLDVRDNLKLPILYNNIVKHKLGVFYIKHDDDVYRLIVDDSKLGSKNL